MTKNQAQATLSDPQNCWDSHAIGHNRRYRAQERIQAARDLFAAINEPAPDLVKCWRCIKQMENPGKCVF